MSLFDAESRAELYTAEYAETVGGSAIAAEAIAAPWRECSGEDRLDVLLEVDVRTYLPGDLLAKIDTATMAHSLEARSPFLDPELMQFAASIPPQLKLSGLEKKRLLRDALRDWLPSEILDRPKQGFSVPLAEWLRGDLRERARELLLDPAALGRGAFREPAVRALLDEHDAGVDRSQRIWALIMLEQWHAELVGSPGGKASAVA
jgi:asparagine synthase (glutamine-hydrolysing)